MDNPPNNQEGPVKKGPLESLSRDELMKKCKGLLALAQKAKLSKDEFAEENRRLKEEVSNYETQKTADKKSLFAMKEIVEALTNNKLTLAGEVADYKARCDRLQNELQQFEQFSIENEALKRQLKRLSDENEELLGDLDTMEKKLEQVNQFGIQQQKDLVLLEKETEKWKSLERTVDQLRGELKHSESENEELHTKCHALEEELSGHKQLHEAQHLKAMLENSQALIATLQAEKSHLTDKLEAMEGKSHNMESHEEIISSQALEIQRLKSVNDKQIDRLQLFKSKIVEFSLKLKCLRKSREVLIETVREYAQSVPKWQKEIMNASKQISNQLLTVESERRRLAEEIVRLNQQLQVAKEKQNVQSIYLDSLQIEELNNYCHAAYAEYHEKVEELHAKSSENDRLQTQLTELNNLLAETRLESDEKSKDMEGLQSDIAALRQKLNQTIGDNVDDATLTDELQQQLHQSQLDCANKQKELEATVNMLNNITEKYTKAIEETKEKDNEIRQIREELEKLSADVNRMNKEHENDQRAIEEQGTSSNETKRLLQDELCAKTGQLKNLEQEKNNLLTSLNEKKSILEQLQSSLSMREAENSDLLAEMRELNEAFKGRGDVISRQQDKIKELDAEVRKTTEKVSRIEVDLSEKKGELVGKESQITAMNREIVAAKDEVASLIEQVKQNEVRIKSLSDEVSTIREKQHDTQSDAISTSTISRVEDVARLREVDESLEEKYNKLRSLAVKLKKKVQEQASHIAVLESENRRTSEEKNEITAKLKVKSLQALQNENDKLLDEVERLKADNRNYEKQLKALESGMSELKNVSSTEKMVKSKFDAAVKEYQNQIKFLKQEKDSMNLIRKEIEKERDALKLELVKKGEEFNMMKAQCDKLKSEVERKKSAEKKSSVLNLEIDAYEKSLNDMTQKLERSKITINELKEDIASREATVQSLNAQIKLLEDSIESEKTHSLELKQQNDIQHSKLKESEHEKLGLRSEVMDKTQECEHLKSEVDELRLQLSTIASDRAKLCSELQTEKENLLRHVCKVEESLVETQNKLKATEHELEDLRAEYASYKIKAQSVLRQNQSKESSRERELEEELNANKVAAESLTAKLKTASEMLESNEKKMDELRQDNERIQRRCKEVIAALEESRVQNEQLLEDNRKQTHDYQESLKTHRLQIDTLNSCYKTQMEDLETKYKNEIQELSKRSSHADENISTGRIGPFGEPLRPANDEQKIDLILMEREDAEGSETTSIGATSRRKSSTARSRREPIPLEELLSSPFDDLESEVVRSISPTLELQQTKEKLQKQKCRVNHLTALLAENEQDLARLTQLNELLKEEVRRQERSLEREPHVQNSEYLKNIVLKFLTLNSGDERSRLVPVLNTILKLSPEETQSLQAVAAGEASSRTWGSYLPIWSNHQ